MFGGLPCREKVLPGPIPPLPLSVSVRRYRAVASWSRVQGVGIPMLTVVEIVCIWALSLFLAVPEAIGFDIVVFSYRNRTMRTCMLNPKNKFMLVGHCGCARLSAWGGFKAGRCLVPCVRIQELALCI